MLFRKEMSDFDDHTICCECGKEKETCEMCEELYCPCNVADSDCKCRRGTCWFCGDKVVWADNAVAPTVRRDGKNRLYCPGCLEETGGTPDGLV